MPENPYQPPRAPLESRASIEARESGTGRKYVLGAIVIGVLEVIDAVVLGVNRGEFGVVTYLVSTLEILWAVVSIYVLVRVSGSARLLAIAFATYIALGIAVGAMLDMSTSVPGWTIIVAGAFGTAYAMAAGFVARGLPGRDVKAGGA